MLLSRPVLAEYRRVLRYARIVGQHRAITPAAVEDVLEKLQYLSDFPSLRLVIFRCDRDPSDEKFIELAIAGSAAYIVTRDRDLLARGSDHSDASKRFRRRLPAARIVRPEQLLAKWNN
jgi:putative PIN family toxin of toxin-antitoxin system